MFTFVNYSIACQTESQMKCIINNVQINILEKDRYVKKSDVTST